MRLPVALPTLQSVRVAFDEKKSAHPHLPPARQPPLLVFILPVHQGSKVRDPDCRSWREPAKARKEAGHVPTPRIRHVAGRRIAVCSFADGGDSYGASRRGAILSLSGRSDWAQHV